MGLSLLSYIPVGNRFNPETDIPSLKGKTILVTGGNSGLGKQSVLELAKHEPDLIWLAARGEARAQSAIDDILKSLPSTTTTKILPLDLDLASFPSVKSAAAKVLAGSTRLDILLLNAGIMATPAGLTASGYELQFGTNHMGHALLTKLLLPLLLKTAALPSSDVRVVVLSSEAHRMLPRGGIIFDSLKTTQENMYTTTRYGQSKSANILFAAEMARRYPQIKTVSVHPGGVATNLTAPFHGAHAIARPFVALYSFLFAVSVEEGARCQLWACVADVKSGAYYTPVGQLTKPAKDAGSEELARRLWEWTEKELEGEIGYHVRL
ncbi:hypothetical protein QBC34DRAFT_487080 [Podospora aff. communis PSN243]|uniref:Oxidoreductase n=1 Tax=Podospora aff. communis PSN243 TaxID=3040156 RepID=A0AAV9GBW5_9PEZI|nr:hypothetical protein QBC34DRAFT_487080 [Podospora aff. communis PSN243]